MTQGIRGGRWKAVLGLGAMACFSTFTSTARAGEAGTGVELGLRLGYAIPLGLTTKTDGRNFKLSDSIFGAVPIILDLGYRVTPHVGLGVYGQYAFGILGDKNNTSCNMGNADCSMASVRAGLQASYILPLDSLEVWLGLTFGLERINSSSKGTFNGTSVDASSLVVTLPEFGVQGGANFKPTPGFSFGPFVSFSMGRYSWGRLTINDQSRHAHVPEENRAFHEWLVLGVRGSYMP
jgi:hypothetical protein